MTSSTYHLVFKLDTPGVYNFWVEFDVIESSLELAIKKGWEIVKRECNPAPLWTALDHEKRFELLIAQRKD